MEREKVLINFRTFKVYKTALDELAEKNGVTVTQFLNDLIFNTIKADIVGEAQTTALLEAIEEFKMPHHLYMELKDFPRNIWERVNSNLGDKKGKQFSDRWRGLLFQKISDGCQRLGFDDFGTAYKELTAGLDDKD
jgi:hypothetical protein